MPVLHKRFTSAQSQQFSIKKIWGIEYAFCSSILSNVFLYEGNTFKKALFIISLHYHTPVKIHQFLMNWYVTLVQGHGRQGRAGFFFFLFSHFNLFLVYEIYFAFVFFFVGWEKKFFFLDEGQENSTNAYLFLSLRSVFIIINGYHVPFSFLILWNVINFVIKFEGKHQQKFF